MPLARVRGLEGKITDEPNESSVILDILLSDGFVSEAALGRLRQARQTFQLREAPACFTLTKNAVDLARRRARKCDYSNAEELLLSALAEAEKTSKESRYQVAVLIQNLARVYAEQRKFSQAEALLVQAATVIEEACGPLSHEAAECLARFAELEAQQENHDRATAFFNASQLILDELRSKQPIK